MGGSQFYTAHWQIDLFPQIWGRAGGEGEFKYGLCGRGAETPFKLNHTNILTRLLCLACSNVAVKRKQRQGTPASLAHSVYLPGVKDRMVFSKPRPPPTAPFCWTGNHHTCPREEPHLHRDSGSGLVLSTTTLFPACSAAWHEATHFCQEPSVSCGCGRQVAAGEGGGQGEAQLPHPTYPVGIGITHRHQVLLQEGGLASWRVEEKRREVAVS